MLPSATPTPRFGAHHPQAPLSFVPEDSVVSWALKQEWDVQRQRCELTKSSELQAAGR